MTAMRNDDFDRIDALRKPALDPAKRKAEREWTGHLKAALMTEDDAIKVRDCIVSRINNSGSLSGGQCEVHDNILTVWALTYRARSANAHDGEMLMRKCIQETGAFFLGPPAVKTVSSRKLGPGR